MKKFKRAVTALGLLGFALIAPACNKAPAAPAAGPPPMPPAKVTVCIVKVTDLPGEIDFMGQTGASAKIEVRARVSGYILTRPFKEGGSVKKGDILFTIDPQSYQADVEIARSQVTRDQTSLEQAKREVTRISGLVERGAAGKRELDDAKTVVELAQASVQLAQAQLAKAQLDLGYTTVKSPFDGKIGEALKHEGAYVDAGANGLLAELVGIDPIYGYFPLSERDRLSWKRLIEDGRIRLPADKKIHVKINLADGSVYEHDGIINYTDVQTNPETGTTTLRADFENPDYRLSPGQFIRASAVGWSWVGVIAVPQRSVVVGETGAFVYVEDAGKAIPRPVVPGTWYKWGWIINKGLNPGDKVIADGVGKIYFPGAPVEVSGQVGLEPAGEPAPAKTIDKPVDKSHADQEDSGNSADSADSGDKPAKQ